MPANITDKIVDIRNTTRPVSTTVSSPRSTGGNTLACASLTGWPTASKVHFVTYKIDSTSNPIVGTQLDCSGIVSGSNIGSLVVIDGTDNGNSVGDVVEMLPTAAWGQDLADALTAQHSRTGTHTAITATSLSTTGAVSVAGALTTTGGLATNNTVSAANLAVNAIKLGYAVVATSQNVTAAGEDLVSVTVTVPAGGRDILIIAEVAYMTGSGASDTATWFRIQEGATVINAKRIRTFQTIDSAVPTVMAWVSAPTPGSHTYKLSAINDSAVTTVAAGAATYPTNILVLAI